MKKILLLACLFYGRGAFAQTCSCSDVLGELIRKTESDYAGYIHKVNEKDSTAYVRLKKQLGGQAANTTFKACYGLMERYVEFFHDGHLYVGEFPAKQPDSLINTVERYTVPADFEPSLAKNTHCDSIEGIWRTADNVQLAIVKTGKNLFAGVIQKTGAPRWEPGMVKMEIEKTGSNKYNVAYYRNDFARVHFSGEQISKNTIFAFGVYRFAKVFPANPEAAYIDPTDPQLPTLRALSKNTVLLTIPSALIDGAVLNGLLTKNQALIESSPNLIIDVRSNGGGNYIWGGVYEIANTLVKEKPKTSAGDDFLLLASEDDARYIYNLGSYYRKKKDSAAIKYYDNLVARIRSNSGKITGFSFYRSGPDTSTRKVYPNPKRIAVIMDKAVASAGEAFILGLKETSDKVTLYGANTFGMIDYMNVNTLPIGDKTCDWYYFGYPTFFAKDIKTKPLNPTGIKPDIYVPANTPDWIVWVKDDLEKQ